MSKPELHRSSSQVINPDWAGKAERWGLKGDWMGGLSSWGTEGGWKAEGPLILELLSLLSEYVKALEFF